MFRKIALIAAFLFSLFSCSKSSQSDLPVIIRIENLTGKEISTVSFSAAQSNTRPQFDYHDLGVNSFSDYAVQTEANFSTPFLIQYADGTSTTVEHPWYGTEQGRFKPDAGKYTYKVVSINGSAYALAVQSHRD